MTGRKSANMIHERENDQGEECDHHEDHTVHSTVYATVIPDEHTDTTVDHTVVKSFKTYCESTPFDNISLQGYMHYFPEKSCSATILGEWTGSVLPYLKGHSNRRKQNAGKNLSRVKQSDILKIILEELRMRDHVNNMLPEVSEQQQLVGKLNTSRLERFVSRELGNTQSSSGKPAMSPVLPTSVHPAEAKHKNIDPDDEHQARRKTRKQPTIGQKAQPVALEALSTLDSPSELSPSELSPWSPTSSLNPSRSSTLSPPIHDMGRRSSLSLSDGLEAKLYVDPTSFIVHKYILNEHNVGQIFHRYQVAASKTVNNFDVSASLKNISHFLAVNYILSTTEELEGIPTSMLEDIRQRFVWRATRLDKHTAEMCGRLDQQLALGDIIHDDTEDPDLRRIVVLYQMVALKLPIGFDLFDNGLEDTYCHQAIDALFAYQFPARSRKFVIDWANGEAHGSKKRRGHGYRPDAVISRNGRQIGFLEVKPPGSCHTVREYLHDYWNLANCAKDAIGDFLQQGLLITKVVAVQLFKHRLSLHTMEYVNGLYHWSLSCVAYIPRDQQDSGLASCIRLLNTLEAFLDTIDVSLPPRTPPRVEYDNEGVQPDCGRPSKVTPTKRKNMF
ncbi:hypothetical protein BGZ99_005192 [Dissophora globulifera]|uniref:Uncharacterized protein n=1 Tax=Dissophora globulifera TaxID=979702 RepID=A0A9P6UU19_9FUNG|nr:hypothetical protein BGZ99_005192 [Dissophora globulifera]